MKLVDKTHTLKFGYGTAKDQRAQYNLYEDGMGIDTIVSQSLAFKCDPTFHK